MHVGEYIKYRREHLGYTQQRVADDLAVSKQAVYKWEKKLAMPDIMILPALAGVLRVSPRMIVDLIWLYGEENLVGHFIFVSVNEPSGERYTIQAYEFDDFAVATKLFEDICAGKNPNVMAVLADYKKYDPARTFQVTITETAYDDDGAEPTNSLLIDSFDLTSLI